MTDKDLIDMLRSKQICAGFQPDGDGGVEIIYGPDPVTARAAWRIEALTAERDMALAEWDDCVERNRPRSVADTTAMTALIAEIEFQALDGEIDCDLARRIITALRALPAERDRLQQVLAECAQFTGICGETARTGLKGETP